MKIRSNVLLSFAAAVLSGCTMADADHTLVVSANAPVADIQPTMYGVFLEDINFAADAGLYAEMVENRSFEAPQQLQGWDITGKVVLDRTKPAFDRNPVYASLLFSGHENYPTSMKNRGYFGMGLKEGMNYEFSVYARKHDPKSDPASLTVQLLGKYDNVISRAKITVESGQWTRYTCTLTSDRTESEGSLRILLDGGIGADVDHVSLFPEDNWNGLRSDLVQDLADLHPGVFRFPGGCVVEGTTLEHRYQWKNSVGPVENRPMNHNRWNNGYDVKFAPNYYMTYGLGFYEYFLLAEKIGAEPLPVVSVGLSCQFQNHSADRHVAVKDLGPYVQDALDLIEFANGPVESKWGSLRAQMGHPEPFGLSILGIGNEQWGTIFPERLEVFVEAIRAKYPEIRLVGSAGPSAAGGDFDYLWKEMDRLGADLVDEHFYKSPEWFLSNAQRYDNYDRSWPKVFAGEYAAHVSSSRPDSKIILTGTDAPGLGDPEGSSGFRYLGDYQPDPTPGNHSSDDISQIIELPKFDVRELAPYHKNNFFAALSEAAFMTGLERNADVVYMTAYAPLFAHARGWQWDPDLIWFDNLRSVRTPNYYVQQMYAQNAGTKVLPILEDGKALVGQGGVYATASFDEKTGDYIVKIVNAGSRSTKVRIKFDGIDNLGHGTLTSLHSDDDAFNSAEKADAVAPRVTNINFKGNVLDIILPYRTFQVYRF